MQRANYVAMSLLYGIKNNSEGMISARRNNHGFNI